MGFEDVLRRRLGPMRDLVRKPKRVETPRYDPASLFYRRAVGLELRIRPEETWAEVEVIRDGQRDVGLTREVARAVVGATTWTHASDFDLKPARLWKLVNDGLLFFAPERPTRSLAGEVGVLRQSEQLARRRSMWPTVAVETAVQIAPMPFMPRGGDLRGASNVGLRFASLDRGTEVLGVTITGSEKTGRCLRALMPLLDGRRTEEEIIAATPEPARTKKMLALLDDMTVLSSERPPRWTAGEEPRVTWLGHAAVLVEMAGARLLVDPLFFSASDPVEPDLRDPKFDPRTLPPMDAILITHGDNDHLNPNSLAMLPSDVPVYAPRVGNEPAPYQVDIFGMLSVLGFKTVVELDVGDEVQVGDVRVTTCPFEGESWGLDLAKVTYLVEGDGAGVYFAADSREMPALCEQLRGRVDFAFLGVSGNAETYVMPAGFGYGNFYADWVPRVRHQEWVQHCAGPKEACKSAALIQPRWVFGYAAGGASYIQTEYSDVGSHEELARLIDAEGLAVSPVALEIGEPFALKVE